MPEKLKESRFIRQMDKQCPRSAGRTQSVDEKVELSPQFISGKKVVVVVLTKAAARKFQGLRENEWSKSRFLRAC